MQRRERDRREEPQSEFKEKLVSVNRVSKTVKGGRNMRFVALVVVGDEKGRVGCGMGKAKEVPEAIRKAGEDAKKHLVNVPIVGTTIPHPIEGYFGTAKVVLLPAEERDRWWRRSPRAGAGRYQGYPHQELRYQQQDQHRKGDAGRPQAPPLRRTGRSDARQDGGRDPGLRGG